MENSRIKIFENFTLSSLVMPYFSYTHKCFLLLSSLCVQTREMLKKNYTIFRRIMMEYSETIELYGALNKRILLPADLYRFKINLRYQADVDTITEFIEKVSAKEGYYFDSQYMHEQICIYYVKISPYAIKYLFPYAEKLDSIICVNDNYCKEIECFQEKQTLLDKVAITAIDYSNNLPHFIHGGDELNREFEPIKNRIEQLTKASSIKIKINNLAVYANDPLELQDITNPEFYQPGIENVECIIDFADLNSEILENLNIINPFCTIFRICSLISKGRKNFRFDFIYILRKLSEIKQIEFNMNYLNFDCIFEFKNSYIQVFQNGYTNPNIFYCSKICCVFEADKLFEDIWFSTREDQNGKVETFMHFAFFNKLVLNKCKFIDTEIQHNETDIIFKDIFPKNKNAIEFIIPLKYLKSSLFNKDLFTTLKNIKYNLSLIDPLLNTNSISCTINGDTELAYVNNFVPQLPLNCYYSIISYSLISQPPFDQRVLNLTDSDSFLSTVMRIRCIVICHCLFHEEFNLILHIFSLSNTKLSLLQVNLKCFKQSESLQLLKACKECINLESKTISFETADLNKNIENE